MSLYPRKRSTRVAVGAAILIALLIAILSTADRFIGADVLPGRTALEPHRLANHITKMHVPSRAVSRNAALDSMLATASAIDGDHVSTFAMPFDEFASSLYFDRRPSDPDHFIESDLNEPNPLLACVGCLGMLTSDGPLSELPFALRSRLDIPYSGFGPVRGGGGSGGSNSATGGGGAASTISGLNPPAGNDGDDQSSSDSDSPARPDQSSQPSDNTGSNDSSSHTGANESSGPNESSSSNNSNLGSDDNQDDEEVGPVSEVTGGPETVPVSVPEPATAALLLLGVGGTTLVRRRERRA